LETHLCEVNLAEVEDLLTQQLEDVHAVFTQRLVGLAGSHKVRDEALPLVGPVLKVHTCTTTKHTVKALSSPTAAASAKLVQEPLRGYLR
jgi:hypothetical protein